MALFKILRGNATNLSSVAKKDGYAYFCTDTHDFYIDYTKADGSLERAQLNAYAADKLTTGRSISLGTAVSSTATTFDGSKNITIPVTGVKEAYLTWGGKNFSGAYGPLDAALIDDIGANRLSFLKPNGITIEASKDNGATWLPYNATITDAQKSSLFTGGAGDNKDFVIGGEDDLTYTDKTNWRLRVTINSINGSVYSELQKFAIYLSTSGSSGCRCSIYGKTKLSVTNGVDTWKELATGVDIHGWSGWNIININKITFGNNANEYYNYLRFEFWVTSHPATSQYPGLSISRIMAFGGMGWGTPSSMAKNGHLYSYDGSQNATFPKDITSGGQVYSKGALKVDGTSTLTGVVTSGALTASSLKSNGALTVSGNSTLNGSLTVKGNTTLGDSTGDTVTIKGPLTAETTLTVKGNTTLGDAATDTVTINGPITAGSTSTFSGAATFSSTVNTGALTASSLTSNGTLSVTGAITANGNVTLGNSSTADTTTLTSKLVANGTSNFKAAMTATSITASGKVTSSEFVGDLTGTADEAISLTWTYFNDNGVIS